MEIVGNGFLARHLRPIAHRHPRTVALAAGVSSTTGHAGPGFAREAALLSEVITRCAGSERRLLFFSTASTGMYGPTAGREDEPVTPGTEYGAHKLALENQLRASGVDHLVLRLGHLVGPGQPRHQLIPTLVRQVREGTVSIHRGASRDLIGVADVVAVIDRMLARQLSGEIVNVASGRSVPVEWIVDHLEHRLGLRARRTYRDGGRRHLISVDKLRRLVPETTCMDWGPGYHRRVLDAVVTAEATATN